MFQHKNYVITIAQTGSFTKAAEKLFLSQPSLSATIKRLENEIGAPLFDRSSSPVRLNEIGEEYVRYAAQIAQLENEFQLFCADHAKSPSGTVRIGGSSFFSSFILPNLAATFKKKFPSVHIEIYENNTVNLLKNLSDGGLDIVVDNAEVRDPSLVGVPFSKENILLAVPKRYATSKALAPFILSAEDIAQDKHLSARCVNLALLKGIPFVLLHPQNDTGKRAEMLLKKYNVTPEVAVHLDQQITAYNVTCTGMGASFVSETLVKRIGQMNDVSYFALDDRLSSRQLFFYYKKSRYLPLACTEFIHLFGKS